MPLTLRQCFSLSFSVPPPPQVVLLASGDALDATRPFRLPLPRLCAVFDVSPAGPYEWSSARLKGLPAMQ